MKKVLVFLLVLAMCLGLCSCMSMDDIEDNLGSSYKKESIDEDDLEEYAELLNIDVEDYEVESAMMATHKKKGTGVMIIECGSASLAEELSEDGDGMLDILEYTYGSKYTFKIEVEGNFVLFGEKSAIKDALGE